MRNWCICDDKNGQSPVYKGACAVARAEGKSDVDAKCQPESRNNERKCVGGRVNGQKKYRLMCKS